MAIENLLAAAGAGAHQAHGRFYRTSHGAEVDLALDWPGGEQWTIEIKRSLTPTPKRGFHSALTDLAPQHRIHRLSAAERYHLTLAIKAICLAQLCKEAQARGAG
jgi:uncharacterized protein